ncbi:putative receptor-like serine/threonine-protein kinase [Acorus calamus]|uniref:non-specific serine/threonine protein kinase n=1 Tax=Acorus calamus TaxID=4465 RepID=A0AAV9FB40_ACOCL|nr:putative receptor-like serine/threonine-protein kinase [Acorus calamus]
MLAGKTETRRRMSSRNHTSAAHTVRRGGGGETVSHKTIYCVAILIAVVAAFTAFLVVLCTRRRRSRVRHSARLIPVVSSGTRTESSADRGGGKGFAAAEEGSSGKTERSRSRSSGGCSSVASGVSVAEMAEMGWGRWYGRKELEVATEGFSRGNVIGEGGYGVVYRGVLGDNLVVAVKNLLNNRGQAEKEFKVEVEAIGKVRHKNLVGLIGYCAEGFQRMLVYEYIDNGNLDQWLHAKVGPVSPLTWEIRMKIAIGTAKGYVAPEYASTGMLNERSDVYSFGVLMMELISGRTPVDYGKPIGEVNLVEWFKGMVANQRSEGVVDPLIETQPSIRALKRVLLVCLRCTDLDSLNRPKMGQVIHMLEGDEFPYRSGGTLPDRLHQAVNDNELIFLWLIRGSKIEDQVD